MSFWLHESSSLRSIRKSHFKHRLISFGGVIIIATSVVLWLLYIPLVHMQISYKKLGQEHATARVNVQQVMQRFDTTYKNYQAVHSDIQRYNTTLHDHQKMLSDLLQRMRDNMLSYCDIQPVNYQKKEFYEKHYFLIGGNGNFNNIVHFLHDTMVVADGIKCKSLILRNESNNVLNFQFVARIISINGG